jgi:hypothetical protein
MSANNANKYTTRPKLQVIEGGRIPDHEWTQAELRRMVEPTIKALPFVKVKKDAEPMWCPESYWHVPQTNNRKQDECRGEHYAILAIAAMRADDRNVLGSIFRAMIDAGVQLELAARKEGRRYPKGDLVMKGFLDQLARMFDPRDGGEFVREFDKAITNAQELLRALAGLKCQDKNRKQPIDLQKFNILELVETRARIRKASMSKQGRPASGS